MVADLVIDPRVETSPSFDALFQRYMRRNTPKTLPEVYRW